jgi:hypothetical protein
VATGRSEPDQDRSPKESATEVWALVRDYAKQETVEPLKGLVTYLKWGLVGAVLVSIGLVELILAVLRAVQAEGGGALDGRWSVVPYLVTLVVSGAAVYVSLKAITRGSDTGRSER